MDVKSRNTSGSATLWLCLGFALTMGVPGFARPLPSPTPVTAAHTDEKEHKHQWTPYTKQVWVAPVVKKVAVGKDKNGKPIYEDRVVRKGYYKAEKGKRCTTCGKEKG